MFRKLIQVNKKERTRDSFLFSNLKKESSLRQSFKKGPARKQVEVPKDLIHAAFFFVDIVGLSDPSMSTGTQTNKIKMLNKFIKESNVLENSLQEELIILPTGDGMFIGFIDGLEQPLKLAIELQEKIHDYNKDKPTKSFEIIEVRIGCHVGNVFLVEDISGTRNVWGPGIIMARRVMDLGDANHILLTEEMAQGIMEINEGYKKFIFPLHDYQIKHGQTILLYSMVSETIGNPKRPTKGFIEEPKFRQKLLNSKKKVTNLNVKLDYTLKEIETNLFEYTRKYEFINNSDEPIYKLMNGILTTKETSLNELHLKVLDKNNQEMKIIGINVDTDHKKEFTFKLNEPIYGKEKGEYSISYLTNEPQKIIENYFFLDTKKLSVSFNFPIEHQLEPQLRLKNNNNNDEIILEPIIKRQGAFNKIEWVKEKIKSNDLIQIVW